MSEAQETYATLLEIDKLLDGIELKIQNISGKVGTNDGGDGGSGLSLRQQIHTLNIGLIAIQQATGNATLDAGIQKAQQFIMVLMRLRMLLFVISELEAGTIGGPLGWAYAGANAFAFGMSLQNLGQ